MPPWLPFRSWFQVENVRRWFRWERVLLPSMCPRSIILAPSLASKDDFAFYFSSMGFHASFSFFLMKDPNEMGSGFLS